MYARVASINLQFMRGVGKMGGLTVNCRVEKRYKLNLLNEESYITLT